MTRLTFQVLVLLTAFSTFSGTIHANSLPARCAGYGNLQSILLTDWDAGLGSWTVGTHHTADGFNTPDWAAVGDLPDIRSGQAAFVENLNSACEADDGTGALTLDSPPILIPGNAQVPRISIEHWFAIELGWDGGNLKIKVNDGGFNLVAHSAIEFGSYTGTLLPPVKDAAPYNTNPLADQEAFTGTSDGQLTGSWGESRINLLGIAEAGDTVQLRFDFGVDQCRGDVGWYVDDVEFYSCEAELPPSDCGNRVIDAGEQCDDGNDFVEDGCSNTCQIEKGWQCTPPIPPINLADHSFEAGTPNPFWTEGSNNPNGTPICRESVCGTGGGTGPSDGLYWLWFGGTKLYQQGHVSQSAVIPSTQKYLEFDMEIPTCDSASDYVEVLIDGTREMLINGSSPLCGIDGYSSQLIDISSYADDDSHELTIHSETFAVNGAVSNFFIDVFSLPGLASVCALDPGYIFSDGFE